MPTAALEIVTPAGAPVVTLDEAKEQVRVTHSFEDAYIQGLVAAATSWAQQETRRLFMPTGVRLSMDDFPDRDEGTAYIWRAPEFSNYYTRAPYDRTQNTFARERKIYLPGGNVSAVESVGYIDGQGAAQSLSGPTSSAPGTDYQEDLTDADHAWVLPPIGGEWPGVQRNTINAVTIDYTVGYADDAGEPAVPEDIKMAIKFRVADLYVIRDSAATNRSEWFDAAENLLNPYRVMIF